MITTKEAVMSYAEIGSVKSKMSISKMFILSVMAGMFIALSVIASSVSVVSVTSPSITRLMIALVFPVGLAMVIFNGTELFTGNTLMIISVLNQRITWRRMLRNWVVVYLGNFTGSLFVTGLSTVSGVYEMFDNGLARTTLSTAVAKCNLTVQEAVVKAIFCNILVCSAVLLTMMAKSIQGKLVALYIPVMVFVICGFEHSIADMGYIGGGLFIEMKYGALGVDAAGLTWFNFLFRNLLPVTIGNIIGGCSIGVAYWYVHIHKPK